ncbi:MAG: HypC/HybG/HupF family hydrogenase formation chaperone [Gaiellaceae bacterium]
MAFQPEACLTCGDVAVAARVLATHGMTALVEVAGGHEEIAIDLVEPVEPGELLLCHAGIALDRMELR